MAITDIFINGVSSKLKNNPEVKECPYKFYWVKADRSPPERYEKVTKAMKDKLKLAVKDDSSDKDTVSIGKRTVIGETTIGGKELILYAKRVDILQKKKSSKKEE